MAELVTSMSMAEFQKIKSERYQAGGRNGKPGRHPSLHAQAIENMTPGEAIILEHSHYLCRYGNGKYSCGVQSLATRLSKSSSYRFETAHIEDGKRVAIACHEKGSI